MDFFLKHKIVIARSLGAVMLVVGFSVHFWVTPKEVLSENDKAQARIERMEASAKGKSTNKSQDSKKDTSKFLDALKDTQAKQVQYMTILAMIFGVGFLGYSFMPKKEDA